MTAHNQSVTLINSLFGRISIVVGPLLLVTVGILTWRGDRSNALPGVLIALGIGLAVSSLFFQPWRVTFHAEGIERTSLLRRHTIPWSAVDSIIRTPARKRVGGLMARTGPRRRQLLTDRAESLHEFERLRESVGRWAPDVAFVARPPVIPEQ